MTPLLRCWQAWDCVHSRAPLTRRLNCRQSFVLRFYDSAKTGPSEVSNFQKVIPLSFHF